MAEIKQVNHTHEAIMLWLLQNPEKSLRQCADHFGYTQPWLSTVIHSDAFKSRFREMQNGVASRVMDDVPARMQRIADIALDKLADIVAGTEDAKFLLETSDTILHRMGYAPSSKQAPQDQAPTAINNTFYVTPEVLKSARANIGITPEKVIEGEIEPQAMPAASQLPAGD